MRPRADGYGGENMARSFSSSLMRAARAADRASRAAARQRAAAARAQDRLQKTQDRQAKLDYLAARQAEVDDENESLAKAIRDLESILMVGLARNPAVSLRTLRRQVDPADLPAPLRSLNVPSKSAFEPKPLGFFAALMPGARVKRAANIASGEAKYKAALAEF